MRRLIFLSAMIAGAAMGNASAQEQTGMVYATCNIQGTPSPMQMKYTRYRDVAVWQDRHGLNAEAMDMGQWGTTYWEGMINTPFGQYRLTGENAFVEAWLVGGVYSDMITLELAQTGPNSFTIRDYYNDGAPMPCEITGQQ